MHNASVLTLWAIQGSLQHIAKVSPFSITLTFWQPVMATNLSSASYTALCNPAPIVCEARSVDIVHLSFSGIPYGSTSAPGLSPAVGPGLGVVLVLGGTPLFMWPEACCTFVRPSHTLQWTTDDIRRQLIWTQSMESVWGICLVSCLCLISCLTWGLDRLTPASQFYTCLQSDYNATTEDNYNCNNTTPCRDAATTYHPRCQIMWNLSQDYPYLQLCRFCLLSTQYLSCVIPGLPWTANYCVYCRQAKTQPRLWDSPSCLPIQAPDTCQQPLGTAPVQSPSQTPGPASHTVRLWLESGTLPHWLDPGHSRLPPPPSWPPDPETDQGKSWHLEDCSTVSEDPVTRISQEITYIQYTPEKTWHPSQLSTVNCHLLTLPNCPRRCSLEVCTLSASQYLGKYYFQAILLFFSGSVSISWHLTNKRNFPWHFPWHFIVKIQNHNQLSTAVITCQPDRKRVTRPGAVKSQEIWTLLGLGKVW